MNESIKRISKESNIEDKKWKLLNDRKKFYQNEREMSKLVLDYNIGKFAHELDEYYYYLWKFDADRSNQELLKKLDEIFTRVKKLEKAPGVSHYEDIRMDNARIKICLDDYYKTINILFRYKLCSIDLPSIYVYNGEVFKHIIDKSDNREKVEDKSVIIYPICEAPSKRDLRHFYNKTSYKYLEGISNDYSFDLEGKNLGKIRILK